jgi:protein gp37
MKNIEWAEFSWNPVWGCRNKCPYCYARKIAKRFAESISYNIAKNYPYVSEAIRKNVWYEDLKNFVPTWIESNFNKPFPKHPARIFVNSMSDIKFWGQDWMIQVLYEIILYPQHTFLFLTKFPEVYSQYKFPSNCWLGVSCTGRPTEEMVKWSIQCKNPHFVSIEPLLEEPYVDWLEFMDWVIVGGLSPKPKHKKHWVDRIIAHTAIENKPVFMKNNLRYSGRIWQEFPEGMK